MTELKIPSPETAFRQLLKAAKADTDQDLSHCRDPKRPGYGPEADPAKMRRFEGIPFEFESVWKRKLLVDNTAEFSQRVQALWERDHDFADGYLYQHASRFLPVRCRWTATFEIIRLRRVPRVEMEVLPPPDEMPYGKPIINPTSPDARPLRAAGYRHAGVADLLAFCEHVIPERGTSDSDRHDWPLDTLFAAGEPVYVHDHGPQLLGYPYYARSPGHHELDLAHVQKPEGLAWYEDEYPAKTDFGFLVYRAKTFKYL